MDSLSVEPVASEGAAPEAMQAVLDAMHWHHSIELGNGLVTKSTAGLSLTNATSDALLDGLNLQAKSLLDVGAWNGAYSFAAKRRGAARVVACDKFVWTDPRFNGRQTFDLARKLLGLEVEAVEMDIPFVTPDTVGVHDVVLFSGVFYHLLEAVRFTRQISACARHVFIVETHQDAIDNPRPSMIFYPGTTLQGDGSNWWGPNPHCMYELLTEFGFGEIFYRNTPAFPAYSRGIYHAFRNAESMAAMGVSVPSEPWVPLSDPAARAALFSPK